MDEIERLLKSKLKDLPLRVFEQDRDQAWAISRLNYMIDVRLVPKYQSGWEGVGISLWENFNPSLPAKEIVEALFTTATEKIFNDKDAISFK